MKKIIILSILLILGLSLVVFALGALKVDFVPQGVAEAEGFVIVNRTPGGTTETTVQIQIWNARPNALYKVRSCSTLIGEFETNKQGKGQIHINLPSDTILCGWMGVWYKPMPTGTMVIELQADIRE